MSSLSSLLFHERLSTPISRMPDIRYNSPIQTYLADVIRVPEYVRLLSLKNEGWENDQMERDFQVRRRDAHTYDRSPTFDPSKNVFFVKGQKVMNELDDQLSLIPPFRSFQFLDLCCCPGGFSQYILEKNRRAQGQGFSLPPEQGGHRLSITERTRWKITYQDITRYDFYTPFLSGPLPSVSLVTTGNGDACDLQPLPELSPQDLIIADGQFLRAVVVAEGTTVGHEPYARLTYSQLIFALTFLRPGGTLVFKLTHCDRYSTIRIILNLQSVSDTLTCFKPKSCWSDRASFYVVAKGVRTDSPSCGALVREWATSLRGLLTDIVMPEDGLEKEDRNRLTEEMIGRGEILRLVPMFKQVWRTQADRLEQMLHQRSNFGRGGL